MSRRATALSVVFGLLAVPLFGGSVLAAPQPRGHQAAVDESGSPSGKKLPALAEPSAPDALSRALETSVISPARYALERARSLFSLQEVRVRFGHVTAPDPRAATMLLRDLAL